MIVIPAEKFPAVTFEVGEGLGNDGVVVAALPLLAVAAGNHITKRQQGAISFPIEQKTLLFGRFPPARDRKCADVRHESRKRAQRPNGNRRDEGLSVHSWFVSPGGALRAADKSAPANNVGISETR